jgi:hypothetical protein
MQKQFERTFEIPSNADVDSMASFITPAHMLVVEIPLNSTAHIDQLNINTNKNDQRRLSFSLNKYNTTDNQGLLSAANDLSNLSSSGQSIRRTSITKTTTTTTSGSSALPAEAAELLRNADTTTGGSSLTYSKHTNDHHSSNTGNQLINNESNTSSSTSSKHTTLTSSGKISISFYLCNYESYFVEVDNLPVDIPPELFTSGGTITIQKRKVSTTQETDGSTGHGTSAPLTQNNNTGSSSTTSTSTHNTHQTGVVPIKRGDDTQSTSSTTTNTTHSTNQTGSVPITRSNDTNSTSLNQQNTSISERRDLKVCVKKNLILSFLLFSFLDNFK